MRRYTLKYCHSRPWGSDDGELVYYTDHIAEMDKKNAEFEEEWDLRMNTHCLLLEATNRETDKRIALLKRQTRILSRDILHMQNDNVRKKNNEIARYRTIAIYCLLVVVIIAGLNIYIPR